MTNSPKPENQGFADLSRQIDDLLEDSGEVIRLEDDGIDLADFTPAGCDDDEPIPVHNFSNGYGAVRNYANGYTNPAAPRPAPEEPAIPAYNADFRQEIIRDQKRRKQEYRDYGEPEAKPKASATRAQRRSSGRKRPGCCGCGCTTVLMLLAVMIAGVFLVMNWFFHPPQSEASLGQHKNDTAAILLCGTDADGMRTDTMMLIYLSGSENRVGLLSLPRDTLTLTTAGKYAKLNSAYGRNGCGVEGMENLLLYVEDIIGFQPDGYLLVDMTLVPKVVDAMGGIEMDLPQSIDVDGLYIPEGHHVLNGQQVLATLRYRAGYVNADLGRVEMQRTVIKAAMEQWVTPANLVKLPQVLSMIQEESITDLTANNFLWIGKTVLLGMGNMTTDTLPGYPDMRGGASYYILYRDQVAELINSGYNPYTQAIDSDDLSIVD